MKGRVFSYREKNFKSFLDQNIKINFNSEGKCERRNQLHHMARNISM